MVRCEKYIFSTKHVFFPSLAAPDLLAVRAEPEGLARRGRRGRVERREEEMRAPELKGGRVLHDVGT